MNKRIFYKISAIILVCSMLTNGNLFFNSYKALAAQPNATTSGDPDLKLRYNTMAGTNSSDNAYDNDESYYKALPLGNGRLGVMAYGNYPNERFDLNEATFWSMGPGNNNKMGASDNLEQVKELMFDGNFKEATSLISSSMIGSLQAKYQSVGNLKLAFGHTSVSNYSRELDMNNAVAYCDYVYNGISYHRESFVSFPDQVFVTRITSDKPGSVSFTTSYECSLSGQYTISTPDSDTLVMDGHGDSGNGVNYASWFNTRTKIINTNGSVSANGNSLSVANADSVVILTSIRTNFVDYKTVDGDLVGKATADIENASAKSYDELYNAHINDYSNLFNRVDVDLGGDGSNNNKPMAQRIAEFETSNDPKLAKVLFQYGRYLMISASRPGGQPMNLQGIWNKFRNPAWDSKLTTNINYEMNYWPALTTNLEECFRPFVDKAKNLQGPGNETARAHYDIPNGWVVHHNTDLWNRTAPIDGPWGMWPTGAGWISNMLYDAYNFNQNTDYLNEVYPVIKGSADFLNTLMEPATNNGQVYQVIIPGTSPELTPPSNSGGQGADCSYGVAMDNGISRELFKAVISASEELNVDSEFRSIIQSKVSQIQPSTIGSWGQIQEWFFDWDSKTEINRHISHVYELFPGNEISKNRNAALAEAAITSLNVRGDEGTGWSEAWKLNCWARLEDGARAYKLIKLLITPVNSNGRLYDNLWGAHPPFQIDGNFGFTSGVTEMLLQSHDNEINLLPALPGQWSTGHANGLRARGDFEISKMNWSNGALSSVTIKSNSGNVCNVRYGNNTISFPTEEGSAYQLNGSLQLIDNSATMSNVALNKMATASGNNPDEEAHKAVDGIIDTKWCHDAGMSGEWLKLDLGAEYDISRWVVKQAGLVEDNKFNARDFTLQKSEDGDTWTDVDTVFGNVQDITDRNVQTFTARYVRLHMNKATQDNSGGARIHELELWGINEAESGILGGNALIIDDNEASGGRAVKLSSIGDSLSFPNSGQASHITFRYSTENDLGKLSLYVDGMPTQYISFEYTGDSPDGYVTKTVPVNIPSGSNFKLQLDSVDSGITLDSVTLMDLNSKQTVKKLTVDIGSNVELNVGSTAAYKVTAEYYDGHTEDVTNKATYNNPQPEIAGTANGTITGKIKGTTIVSVSYKGAVGDAVTAQITITVTLGNPYTINESEAYNQQSGVQNESCSEGGQNVGYIENGSWIKFNGVDFGTGAASFEARVASQDSGGNIEIRLDSLTGPVVGTCPVTSTGGWQTWATKTCEVSGATGAHDLYLIFTGGSGYLFNMNWWKFNPLEVAPEVLLNKTSISMKIGDTDTLIATVYPLDLLDKTVSFSSSNPEIATVTEQAYNPETGATSVTVNATAEGNAFITATMVGADITAVCSVKVDPTVEPELPAVVLTADSRVNPGATFIVGVGLDNLDWSIHAEDITLSYDSNKFEYVSAVGLDEDIKIIEEDKSTDGEVRLIAANIGGTVGESAQVINVTFKVKPGVHSTTGTIEITKAELGIAPEGKVVLATLDSKVIIIGETKPVIDRTALTVAIDNAQSLYDAAVVGTQPGEYPKAAKDALNTALDEAKAIKDDSNATQSKIDDAVIALNSAVNSFKAAAIGDISPDLNNNGRIDIGDLAYVAYYYGKNSLDEDWEAAKIADMNGDNKIDIIDLVYVASRIIN